MPDFAAYIRQRMPDLGLPPARESEIIEELAQQLEARYNETLPQGEAEAWKAVAAEIPDWNRLANDLRASEPKYTPAPDPPQAAGWFSDWPADFRYSLRLLAARPGFTTAALLTLALGIGPNIAIFSVVDQVLLRPPEFDSPDRLFVGRGLDARGRPVGVAYAHVVDWRQQAQSFEGVAVSVSQSVNYTGIDEPTRVIGSFVSANLFDLLGIKPVHGRLFRQGEDQPGAERFVILAESLWRSRFGGNPKALGRVMELNGQLYAVIGVAPDRMSYFGGVDVYLPASQYPNYTMDRVASGYMPLIKLKPGVRRETAQAELDAITSRLAAQYPDTDKDRRVVVQPLQEAYVQDARPAILALYGAVCFLLLIACANVANLVLARHAARRRENAIRAALGAGRHRLIRLVLAETTLVAVSGCVVGLLIAYLTLQFIVGSTQGFLPWGTSVKLDLRIAGFAFLLSLLIGPLVGIIPAISASRGDLHGALRQSGRSGVPSSNRLRSALIVTEVALSLMLLCGAGLMLRSLWNVIHVHPGFDPSNLLTLEYRLPRNKYPKPEQQIAFHEQVVDQVSAIPGVESASSTRATPLGGNARFTTFFPADKPQPPASDMPRGLVNAADPHFLKTMRIPLLKGRWIEERDLLGTPMVAVISQLAAQRYFAGQDPIGKVMNFPEVKQSATIIGVVGDIKHTMLSEQPFAQMYVPVAQDPFIFNSLVVPTSGDPQRFAQQVRKAIWSVDKDQPVWKVRPMEELVARSSGPQRFLATLLAGYAGLSLLLAAVGLFGVMAYLVSQRTSEIAIRVALGASRPAILRLILKHGTSLALLGAAIGVAGAFALTRYLATQLYGVSATDPLVYVLVTAVLLLVAIAACLAPARRAMRVDPLVALREE